MKWKTYSSEERVYNFGNVSDDELKDFSKDFFEKFDCARKKSREENLGLNYLVLINHSESKILKDWYLHSSLYFYRDKGVKLETERLYFSADNQLMSAGNFDLATIKEEEKELILKINGHHTLGIDPSFLYEFGEERGKIIT